MTDENVFKGLSQAEDYLSKRKKKELSEEPSHHSINEKESVIHELKSLRKSLNITQREFARRFGFSLSNVRNWEQEGRGVPDASSRLLIEMIKIDPEAVAALVRRTEDALSNRECRDINGNPRIENGAHY
ncbi:helix-turn-helix domain-containing protein [Azospirillum argentinense]